METKIIINDKEYTLNEAKELYTSLEAIFGKENFYYPSYPFYPSPYDRWSTDDIRITYTDSTGGTDKCQT